MPYPKDAQGLAVPSLTVAYVEQDTANCNVDTEVFKGGCFKIGVMSDVPAIYTIVEAIGTYDFKKIVW